MWENIVIWQVAGELLNHRHKNYTMQDKKLNSFEGEKFKCPLYNITPC